MGRDIIDVYDRSIFEMRNVFTTEECKMFIDYHEQSPEKSPGELVMSSINRTFNSVVGASFGANKIKQTTDVGMTGKHTHERYLIDMFRCRIHKVYMEYMKHLNDINKDDRSNRLYFGELSNPKIQRTSKGDFFNWHNDYLKNRTIAIIIYLNDIDEENGGSTEFNSGRKVQPETGKVLVFPTTYLHLHRGNTILNGPPKYIISAFVKTPDPITPIKVGAQLRGYRSVCGTRIDFPFRFV